MLKRPIISPLQALFITGLLAMGKATAAPPPNDNFADRIPISGARVTANGSNIDATLESGEPRDSTVNFTPSLKTVWWTWTAPADGGLAVSLTGSDFIAVASVYTGSSVSNLMLVPGGQSGTPASGRTPSAMRVTAGTAYQIAVGSWSGDSGKVVLDLAFLPSPSNDDFANRLPLGSGNMQVTGFTLGATVEAGEQVPTLSPGHGTLWWSWTALTSGPVMFQAVAAMPAEGDRVFGVDYPHPFVALGIFVGESLEGLTLVTNWSAGKETAPPLNQLVVDVVAGTTYQVSVTGEPGFLDQFELAIARTTPPGVILTGPLNGAEFVVGTPVNLAAETVDFDGKVTGVEFFARASSSEVEFTQANAGRPFRGMLTNLPPDRYDLIARSTDDSGIKSDSIPLKFNVRPINDFFANRTPFTGAFVTVTGTLANASAEAEEPSESGRASVWWAWTAPASGTFTFTAAAHVGPEFSGPVNLAPMELELYTGTALTNLSTVPQLPGGPSRAVFQATGGFVYAISISSSYGKPYTLQVAQTAPPTVTLTSPTNQMRIVEGGTVTFSAEAVDPDGNISRVEFFTDFDFSLGAVSNAPFSLSRSMEPGYYFVHAVATDDNGITTRSDEVFFHVIFAPPVNDDFTNRIRFTGSFVTITGDTANATLEVGEEFDVSIGSVWWEWTAPETGDYCVTANISYGPSLRVYTGDEVSSLTLITNGSLSGSSLGASTLVTIHAMESERYQIAVGIGGPVRVDVARTLPPSVRITSPTNGAVFQAGETVEVRAEASDQDGTIDRVEFYFYGALFATLTNEPFALSIPLTYPSYYQFQAQAFDNHGVAGISDKVTFQVPQPGPPNDAFANRISFTGSFLSVTGSTANATMEPGEGYWVQGGSVWWEWAAPVSGKFTIDVKSEPGFWPSLAVFTGTNLAGLTLITNQSYRGDVPGYSVQVVIEAESGVAYPIAVAAGRRVALSVERTTPPSVTILQPAPNSVFFTGDPVVLQADASDVDGTIRSVEFFLYSRLLGIVTNAPFVLQTTFREGNAAYYLRARVTDDHGISTFSDYVQFQVRNRPPVNDNFADRTELHGWFVTLEAADWDTTREPGEPTPSAVPGSLWWRWMAPASGRVTLACDQPFAYVGVFLGTNVMELSVVAAGQSATAGLQLEFDAMAGVDYSIVFQSISSYAGPFRMSLLLDARELLGPRMPTPGLFAFDLRTTFDRTWIIEATTNLVDWTPVAAGHCANGTLEFLDPTASTYPRRFYRAVADR